MRHLTCLLVLAASLARATPVLMARVQDGETRRALAGVLVRSEGSDVVAATDSLGRCRVVVLPRRGRPVVASRSGYHEAQAQWEGMDRRAPGQDTLVLDLLLYPRLPRVVIGKVTDAGTRMGLAGAVVMVEHSGPAESADVDGGFALADFPFGPQRIMASYPGYPAKSVLLVAKGGETTEVNLALVDTTNVGRLVGVVSEAGTGAPAPAARVSVEGTELTALSDAAGRYAIENVPVGQRKLHVSCPGYVSAYTTIRLVKDWTVEVNLYLKRTGDP